MESPAKESRIPDHKPGTIWQHDDGDCYILATIIPGLKCLVALEDGNRYADASRYFPDVFGKDRESFTRVLTPVTINPEL